ncbi:hypothetical protein ABIB90_006221 [Bradyrhizobium sp. JR4.1]
MKIRWWQWIWLHWLPRQPLRCLGEVESADEIPEKLPQHAAVVVRTSTRPKWVAFDCPCKSGIESCSTWIKPVAPGGVYLRLMALYLFLRA